MVTKLTFQSTPGWYRKVRKGLELEKRGFGDKKRKFWGVYRLDDPKSLPEKAYQTLGYRPLNNIECYSEWFSS